MSDPDPRVRANALEALKDVDDDETRELLRTAMRDSNNRVVGNALLGLYRAGDCTSIAELLKMAEAGHHVHRSTAAWAMGESGDARFLEVLRTLAADANPQLRRRATMALEQVEVEAASETGEAWRMELVQDLAGSETAERRLLVVLQRHDGGDPPPIPSTRFQIFEDNQPVLDYSVERLEVPGKLALAILIPIMPDNSELPAINGALRALAWKRPGDAWSAVRYKPPRQWNLRATLIGEVIDIAPPEEVYVPGDPPVFVDDSEVVAQVLDEVPESGAHHSIWDAILEARLACESRVAGDRVAHLVLYCPGQVREPCGDHAARLGDSSWTVPVHCITQVANPFLERICELSRGTYHLVDSDEGVVQRIHWLHGRLLASYLLSYPGASGAGMSHLQVRTAEGWSRAALLLGRTESRFSEDS